MNGKTIKTMLPFVKTAEACPALLSLCIQLHVEERTIHIQESRASILVVYTSSAKL